jgi:hypothetical protein
MPACAGMTELRAVILVPAFAGIDSSGNPVVLCTKDNSVILQGKMRQSAVPNNAQKSEVSP